MISLESLPPEISSRGSELRAELCKAELCPPSPAKPVTLQVTPQGHWGSVLLPQVLQLSAEPPARLQCPQTPGTVGLHLELILCFWAPVGADPSQDLTLPSPHFSPSQNPQAQPCSRGSSPPQSQSQHHWPEAPNQFCFHCLTFTSGNALSPGLWPHPEGCCNYQQVF